MNTIKVNAQNGVASSAVKNLEVVVYYGDTNTYEAHEIVVDDNFFNSSLHASIYSSVRSGKKDMYLSVKFNGADEIAFWLNRDENNKYVLVIRDCEHGNEDLEIELGFSRVTEGKNINAIVEEIEGYIYNVIESIDLLAEAIAASPVSNAPVVEANEAEQEQEVCDAPELDDVDIELANDRLADWLVKRANGTMGDYFTDVTENMWDYSRDDIDEDRLRDILLENVDGLVDVEFAESDDAIVSIWFNRPIKKDVLVYDIEDLDMTDEEIELINDIVSCVEADGYYYTRLDNEKKIIDKFIDTDEDLQRFEFIKEGDYYHFIATDIIEDTIFQNIIEEAANGCVPDVSGAWYDYEDYRDYLDWDKIISDVEGYFTDAELKDDFLYDYYNCADDIYNAIKRHMDKFDDEVKDIKLDWGELDDEVAYFMVADDEFAEYVMTNVEEWLDIEEWLVYDDGLYIKFPVEEPTEEPTEEEQELIDDIVSTVSDEGHCYTCLEKEKAILDKYIETDDELQRFDFIVKGDYYHFFDVDIIDENIVNAIVAEAGENCVADVSGAWDEYTDYNAYINWDYISQRVADEFDNAKLEGDYLFNYWECADAIYKAINRHGDEIKHGRLKLNWDEFEEDFADYMVTDDEFADEVMSTLEDWMDIEEWLTYDDGLYLRLPDDEEVVPVQSVEDYIMDISSRPSYVKKENITIEYGDKELVVGLFGSYFVKLYNDDVHAAAYCSEGLAWGKEDLMFAYDIMDYKSHIWAIVNENRRRAA